MGIRLIESLFKVFCGEGNKRRIEKIKKRAYEVISLPTILLLVVLIRVLTSFVGWFKAILISWGVLDGVLSKYIYREEKFFPYQFLRYGRIVANLGGIISPIIPLVWNISDGIYSMIIYEKAYPIENLSRLGRVLNGAMFSALS